MIIVVVGMGVLCWGVRGEAEATFVAGGDEMVSVVVRIWRSDCVWACNGD